MVDTKPSASPQAPPTPPPSGGSTVDQQLALLQDALTGSGSGGTDLYGLGQWKNQPVDPSGFPPAVVLLLQQAGIDTSQKITGAQLAQALAQVKNPGLVAQLQQMLFYAGAYGSSVKSMGDLQVGIFGQQDVKALGDVITTAGQTGTPFGTYLTSSANYGKANGILNTISGATQNPVAQASRADTDPVLRAAAHDLFGHDPSADEYARFQAFYNQKLLGEAQSKTAAVSPTDQNLPDAYTLGQAIGDQNGGLVAPPSTVPFLKGPQQRSPDFADLTKTNPEFSAYQQQQAQDQQALGAVNSAANSIDNGSAPTFEAAPKINAAAEAFLRQDNPAAIGQQNIAQKYGTLLSILTGTGA